MPVLVGLILSVILLISFSGWFYHLVNALDQFVLDDYFFWYRIGTASAFSMMIMTLTFFGMAYVSECPELEKNVATPLASKLNCPTYNRIKTNAEEFFKKRSPSVPNLPKNDLESQAIQI